MSEEIKTLHPEDWLGGPEPKDIKQLEALLKSKEEEIERLKENYEGLNGHCHEVTKVNVDNMRIDKQDKARIAELEEALGEIRGALYDRDTYDEVLKRIGDILTEKGFPWQPED